MCLFQHHSVYLPDDVSGEETEPTVCFSQNTLAPQLPSFTLLSDVHLLCVCALCDSLLALRFRNILLSFLFLCRTSFFFIVFFSLCVRVYVRLSFHFPLHLILIFIQRFTSMKAAFSPLFFVCVMAAPIAALSKNF